MWRSRSIKAPKGRTTRPTSDRVREALFSMLEADAHLGGRSEGERVLDLYAGSGALAFEALSRGAKSAVLVEQARDALATIRDNARSLGTEGRITIVHGRVEHAVIAVAGPFDVIVADPPYAHIHTLSFQAVLEATPKLLAASGAFVLEHASSDQAPAVARLTLDRSRRYGDTTLSVYRHAGECVSRPPL
ncbi:MAG: 16S rRNA (guanine(966)-N(2))-methyltransferase RsmD [Polyangiaceae bacterium]|nr:16S rRNA (guanine(966)-N(2))-methyltransferase RsmD [Polyangiaceae bacterium]